MGVVETKGRVTGRSLELTEPRLQEALAERSASRLRRQRRCHPRSDAAARTRGSGFRHRVADGRSAGKPCSTRLGDDGSAVRGAGGSTSPAIAPEQTLRLQRHRGRDTTNARSTRPAARCEARRLTRRSPARSGLPARTSPTPRSRSILPFEEPSPAPPSPAPPSPAPSLVRPRTPRPIARAASLPLPQTGRRSVSPRGSIA